MRQFVTANDTSQQSSCLLSHRGGNLNLIFVDEILRQFLWVKFSQAFINDIWLIVVNYDSKRLGHVTSSKNETKNSN